MPDSTTKILHLDIGDYSRLFYFRRETDFQTLLYLLLLAGMPPEDAAALRWEKVDTAGGTALVNGRCYVLPGSVRRYLTGYRAAQLEKYFAAGRLAQLGPVCVHADGSAYTATQMLQEFADYLIACGSRPMTPAQVRSSLPDYLYEHDQAFELVRMYLVNSRIRKTI